MSYAMYMTVKIVLQEGPTKVRYMSWTTDVLHWYICLYYTCSWLQSLPRWICVMFLQVL